MPVGLSDHTCSNITSIVAAGLGAKIIEKHFILDRTLGGVDSEFSLEPAEMRLLVEQCKSAYSSGDGSFSRPPSESKNRVFRRSLYFVANLKAGEIIGGTTC